MKTVVLLLPMLLATVQARTKPATCDLHIRKFAKENPLILKPIKGTNHYEIDDPDRGDEMFFESGQKVVFACPGTGFKGSKGTLLNAECIGREYFEKEDGSHQKQSFKSFKCNGLPRSVLKEDGMCAVDKSAYAIGFEVEDIFVKVMDICFDEDTDSAVYVKHKVSHNIDGSQKHFARPQFKADILFDDVDTKDLYRREHQIQVFSEYAGSRYRAGQYVNGHQFLSRGHLAAKADYVFGAQQTATFYYANAAPQWQSFNGENWSRLESAVRRLAVDRGVALTVYTGTHGVFRVNGKPVYLGRDSNGRRTVPVPMVFWKVVVDEAVGEAIAFAGLNDPHGDAEHNEARDACGQNLCDRMYWVLFDSRPESGLMYCCTVDSLRKNVRTFPPVGDVKLLTD